MNGSQFNAGILGAFLAMALVCAIVLIAAELRKRLRVRIWTWRDIRGPKTERSYIKCRQRIERRRRVAAKPRGNGVHIQHDPSFIPEWLRDEQLPRLLRRHWA